MASINRDYARSSVCHHVSHFLMINRFRLSLSVGMSAPSGQNHILFLEQLVADMEKELVRGHEAVRLLLVQMNEVKEIDREKLDRIERLMQEVMDKIGHD